LHPCAIGQHVHLLSFASKSAISLTTHTIGSQTTKKFRYVIRPRVPRRPELPLRLVEAVGHPAVRAVLPLTKPRRVSPGSPH
jgi:hypothetical protein